MNEPTHALTDPEVDDAVRVLKSLADPIRLRLYSAIVSAGEEAVSFGELHADARQHTGIGTSQPNISRHLDALVRVGLATREQRGRLTYYAPGAPGSMGHDLAACVVTRAGR